MANTPAFALTTISGGINRLRTKGGADKNSLYELLNGYVTQSSTVKVRPGTFRNANIATYAGAGTTKGLLSYQSSLHTFSSAVVPVPPGYALHVLNHPASSQVVSVADAVGIFPAGARVGNNPNAGLVSNASGFAAAAILTPSVAIGSMTPNLFAGATIYGFFQATAGSTSDPNQVYLVLGASPALPSAGMAIYYPNSSGGTTIVALNTGALTNALQLGSAYAVYALGTVTPQYSQTSILLHLDGPSGADPFPDSSGNGLVTTSHNLAAIDTTHAMFGAGALSCDGISKYLTTPIAPGGPLDIGLGDFTIEFWLNPSSFPAGGAVPVSICQGSAVIIQVNIGTAGANSASATVSNSSSSAGVASTMVLNAYSHVALSVQGGTGYLFINGQHLVGNTGVFTVIGRTPLVAGAQLVLGAAFSPGLSFPYNGYIDELRITKGSALYTAPFTPAGPLTASINGLPLQLVSQNPYPIKEIHFSAPYLGGIYVVAEFAVPDAVAAQYGTVFHFWVQSSTGGDNSNAWKAKTDYRIGDVVIPTAANGLTYVASRHLPANPVWMPNTAEAVSNIVEPITANGFQYAATAVLGANPTTGAVEPTWPVVDGGVVNENSALAVDQTITLATAANTVTTPATPARYVGIAGGFKPGA